MGYRRPLALAGAAAIALSLAGCGVKGPLEPPPDKSAPASESKAQITAPPMVAGPDTDPRRQRALRQLGTPTKPDDSFVLDPLL
jgi:predicted small lipoprotein YifL